MFISHWRRSLGLLLVSAPFLVGGCECNGKTATPKNDAAKTESSSTAKPKEPLVKPAELVDWCKEHGVPESACTRCNRELIDGFKKKGDWCAKHDLPESQCILCHPELKAKLEAMKPKGA